MNTTVAKEHARTFWSRWSADWHAGLAAAFILVGAGVRLSVGGAHGAALAWGVGLAVTGLPLVMRTLVRLRHHNFATDVVATLSVVVAAAIGEPLVGLVIVLMQAGGEALERRAEGRASVAVRALEKDAPRVAHRRSGAHLTTDVAVDSVLVDDVLLVRPGEMIPCDGIVIDGMSHVDTARITGEPLPVPAASGSVLSSGVINIDGLLTLRVTAVAGQSAYAQIVELVRTAQASKAPLQRLADRFAAWFTPVTILVCVIAYAVSGDWQRVLAVLVVATPCPLILATPVAMIGGLNRAARSHIIVRSGRALERLATTDTVAFDKTGTLTVGQPVVSHVTTTAGFPREDLLRLAAAVEVGSGHPLARSVVRAAEASAVSIVPARDVIETAGSGVCGRVDGRRVCVGSRRFAIAQDRTASVPWLLDEESTGLRAFVVVDGATRGMMEFADVPRPGIGHLLHELARLGIRRTLLLSGDSQAHSLAVARTLGIVDARGELTPSDKVRVVRELLATGARVAMVGDGTNDAPALAAAHVGIALAGTGRGVTTEAADVVLLGDDIARLPEAIRIGRRTLRIARQSIMVGLGLSAVAMVAAAWGLVPPVIGAFLQEAVDISVILNALRASRDVPNRMNHEIGVPREIALAGAVSTHDQLTVVT